MFVSEPEYGRLVITEEPIRIRFESEPFVTKLAMGYTPAAFVISVKSKKHAYLILGASSIANQLEPLRLENGGMLLGLEIWIRKESADKMAKYVIET